MDTVNIEVERAVCPYHPVVGSRVEIRDEVTRFMKFVRRDIDTGCWLWTGRLTGGYGEFWFRGRKWLAHRVAWIVIGERIITASKPCILHSCDEPRCVNVAHLWDGTKEDNNIDKARKNRGVKGVLPYGVSRHRTSGHYVAHVGHKGELVHLGTFRTLEEASTAAVKAKQSLLGVL